MYLLRPVCISQEDKMGSADERNCNPIKQLKFHFIQKTEISTAEILPVANNLVVDKFIVGAIPGRIGDNFTMDAADAVECARMIQCNTIAGVHYDTFGFIKIDHEKARKAFSDAGMKLHLIRIGDSITL